MIPALLLALGSMSAQQAIEIRSDAKGFLLSGMGQTWTEPFQQPSPASAGSVVHRKDEAYAVWDSRGLVLRLGKSVKTTKLPDIALTPKLFTPEQIEETKAKIASGARTREAYSLAGSARIGDIAYWLVRWHEKGVGTWLEALVRVDLSQKPLQAQLVGRFDGLTLPGKAVDDRLNQFGGKLTALTSQKDGSWGIAAFTPADGAFTYSKAGDRLRDYALLNPVTALAQEASTHGTRIAVGVDLTSGARRDLFEFRGNLQVVQAAFPTIVRVTGSKSFLRNIETGGQLPIASNRIVRRTPLGLLLWQNGKPETAVLLEPDRWSKVASVSKG
jgi:hypothetical protein